MKSVDPKCPNWYKIKIPMDLRSKISKFVEQNIEEMCDFKHKKNSKKKEDKKKEKKREKTRDHKGEKQKKSLGFNVDAHFVIKRTENGCFFKIVLRNYNNILLIELNNRRYHHSFYDGLLNCIEVIPCNQCGEYSNCDWNGRTPCLKTGLERCSCVTRKETWYLPLSECQLLEDQCYEYIDTIKDLIPLRKPGYVKEVAKINGNEYYWILKKIRSSKVKLTNSDTYYIFFRISRLPKELIKMISVFVLK